MAEVAGHLGDVGLMEGGDNLGIHDHEFIDDQVRDQLSSTASSMPHLRYAPGAEHIIALRSRRSPAP